jgi:hypothetical protein
MTTTRKPRKAGLLVQADDLRVGKHYAVHSLKNGSEEPLTIFGQAFKVSAINLPYFVGNLAVDPTHPPVTFDVRYLNIMHVSKEYVEARRPDTSHVPDPD